MTSRQLFDETLEHISQINRANSAQEVCSRLLAMTGRFGLDRMIIGSQQDPAAEPEIRREHILLGGWSPEWIERYIGCNYVAADPVVHFAKHNMQPFTWDDAARVTRGNKAADRVMAEAGDFGMRHGMSIPLVTTDGTLALLSLGGEHMDLPPAHFGMVALVSTYAIERALHLSRGFTGERTGRLTRREAECIRWAAAGKSEWEISRILGISEHTSEKHLLSAKTKLGAVNRTQAVAEAIRQGYIT
ncbi:MAG: LuxR family transcriptional regulator [Phyllobacteriaceae bacterium]|nr:LuxR family transcriptional regulator [Phyllobacteriaceae bacterium]MBA91586.1 LuxR family transcriptional regulator [Phyllobacteriaceae bacterium]